MKTKEGIKVMGWDDGPFEFDQKETVPVVGAVTRGGGRLDGLVRTELEVDGLDGTSRLASAIKGSKHRDDVSLLMLDGITFGGFNVIDIKNLAEETGLPVLAVTRTRVKLDSFRAALEKLPKSERRWKAVQSAGIIRETSVRGSSIYFQTASLTREEAERVISTTSTHSVTPEPIRLANMISRALVLGES
jgi:hypothetical protein